MNALHLLKPILLTLILELIRRGPSLLIPEQSNNPSMSSTRVSSYSSSSYRQKGAALIEQIKSDVQYQRRIHLTTHADDTTNFLTESVKRYIAGKEIVRQATPARRKSSKLDSTHSSQKSSRKSNKSNIDEPDFLQNLSRLTIHERPVINFTLTPPTIVNSINIAPHSPPINQQLQSTLAPPSYPSVRLNIDEDLNRFVSSSTASGSTLTAGSAPSFVKHPGPVHIRTIAPGDLPALPERFGDMFFDKTRMKWVKKSVPVADAEKSFSHATDASEDPFCDIESLRDESRTEEPEELISPDDVGARPLIEMTRIEERSEVDEEEVELSNFSTDISAHVVQVMTGVETDAYDDETTDSESTNDDIHTATQAVIHDIDYDSEFDDSPSRDNLSVADVGSSNVGLLTRNERLSSQCLAVAAAATTAVVAATTPIRGNSGATTPIIKSALKSNSTTPTPALKIGNRSRFQTPNNKGHRRSVSFSDGKRDGPMRGEVSWNHFSFACNTEFVRLVVPFGAVDIIEASAAPSVRTKRIADMMAAFESGPYLSTFEYGA